ncbi:MAG: sigma-54-dependent Fis family transcriptional regulator [Polyangiaceae bacterium]|nr:sigma-54-dependent Fis family transcriptional regulator [Polyangiaceae bacterium]
MRSRGRILIVDDEANARAALSEILHEEGYATEVAADGFKALGKIDDFSPDVVLTDLKMPGLDGIGLMQKARELAPHATFVVMTAFGTIPNAVEAVQKGAYQYLTKPLDFPQLALVVERAVERSRLILENAKLKEKLRDKNPFGQIVAGHPTMLEALELAGQVASSKATVLVVGETGTGKELVAELIHRESPRKNKPLVRLNCAALSESLLESELFGHERGAFTGAVGRREGRFEQADGGTLFLDEVSEIPMATQVKLLRVLQERAFERVGGNDTIHVDVRIISASNRDLEQRVKDGQFREDLYYRLNVVTIPIPPLRERASDIAPLATFFLGRYAEENGKRIEGMSDEVVAALGAHTWPGNVRELENVIERAVVLCDGARLELKHLPRNLVPRGPEAEEAPRIPGATIQELERWAILKTLEACRGSTSRAAAILGVSPRKIQYKLREYAGEPPASSTGLRDDET